MRWFVQTFAYPKILNMGIAPISMNDGLQSFVIVVSGALYFLRW